MFVCLCLSENIISATFRPVFTIFSAARSTDRSITAFGTIRELGKKCAMFLIGPYPFCPERSYVLPVLWVTSWLHTMARLYTQIDPPGDSTGPGSESDIYDILVFHVFNVLKINKVYFFF